MKSNKEIPDFVNNNKSILSLHSVLHVSTQCHIQSGTVCDTKQSYLFVSVGRCGLKTEEQSGGVRKDFPLALET